MSSSCNAQTLLTAACKAGFRDLVPEADTMAVMNQLLCDINGGGSGDGPFLPEAGGTMTGPIVFAGSQPTGTTAAANIVRLTDSIASTSTTTAATPNSVKTAYDAAISAAANSIAKNNGTGTNTSLSGDSTHPALTLTNPDSTKAPLELYNTAIGAANGCELRNGYGGVSAPAYAIPTFRPTTAGNGVGFDIMANTAGLGANVRKPVWMDVCPYDFQTANGSQQEFARYGYDPYGDSTVVVLGSNAFNTGAFRNLIAQPYGGKFGVGTYSYSDSSDQPAGDVEFKGSGGFKMGFDVVTLTGGLGVARRMFSYSATSTQRPMLFQGSGAYVSLDSNATYEFRVDSNGTTTKNLTSNGTVAILDASVPNAYGMAFSSATVATVGGTGRFVASYVNSTFVAAPTIHQASAHYWTIDGNTTNAFAVSSSGVVSTIKHQTVVSGEYTTSDANGLYVGPRSAGTASDATAATLIEAADGTGPKMTLWGSGSVGSVIELQNNGGTHASPSGTAGALTFASINGKVRDSSGNVYTPARIAYETVNTQTSSDHGVAINFEAVSVGGTTRNTVMSVFGNGVTITDGTTTSYTHTAGALQVLGVVLGEFQANGTATTCTGATIGTGSKANAGFVTATTTGVSTVVITFPFTAPTGWAICPTNNTTANLIRQTASSTTTATISGTTVSGDVISYIAMAY